MNFLDTRDNKLPNYSCSNSVNHYMQRQIIFWNKIRMQAKIMLCSLLARRKSMESISQYDIWILYGIIKTFSMVPISVHNICKVCFQVKTDGEIPVRDTLLSRIYLRGLYLSKVNLLEQCTVLMVVKSEMDTFWVIYLVSRSRKR